MNRFLIALSLIATTLISSACNRGPSVDERNASVDEVAAKVREATGGAQFIRAGQWKSTTVIEEMSVPGMPPAAAAQMKQSMAEHATHESSICLTEEQVKQPTGAMLTGKNQCRYEHFTMKGGKIDAKMVCDQGGGVSQTMTMAGSYSPESYQMRMQMNGQGSGPGEGMTMRMRVDSKRIGACDGKQADQAS